MTTERDKLIQDRNRLKSQFGQLFTEIEQILFRHDPIGIAFVDNENVADNPDEYAPEVGTILPRLATAKSATDVTDIVYEEFTHWFDDKETAGSKAKYKALSTEIWAAWNRFKTAQKK
jgi:hypothetical protein